MSCERYDGQWDKLRRKSFPQKAHRFLKIWKSVVANFLSKAYCAGRELRDANEMQLENTLRHWQVTTALKGQQRQGTP